MNPYQNNFNNKSRGNAFHTENDFAYSYDKNKKGNHKSLGVQDDHNEVFGFPNKNRDSNYKNFSSKRNPKDNKGELFDYEFDLMSEKNTNSSNYNRFNDNKQREFRNINDNRGFKDKNFNPDFKRKNRKNSDEELEIKMPFENFGNQRRSYQIEKNSYSNPRNFGVPATNLSESSKQVPDQKINYKLQKKIKKGEVDDEIEIINSYAKENTRFLPIEEYSKEFIYTLENSNVIIVMGETGSGKTTKIPEFMYKSGKYNIAHILPRKISAITVAQRVAKNMNFTLGKEVGYSVRFDYNYNEDTKIKFLTEGMFIREILADPLLNTYNYIIIDDCHERTINSEMIFGLLKKIFVKRSDLKIVISSATLDYDAYMNFFSKESGFITNTFVIPGRTFPVDIYYTDSPVKNYVQASISTALTIHKNYPINSGDILVFLTGQEEINNFIELCGGTDLDKPNVLILPLCSGLNIERQLEVFKPTPYGKRKIVLSTNIAEASVTIDNIGFVIDSCFVKMKFYNSKIDTDALYIIPASKFSLDQRAGRAGRTRPGKCFRLITKQTFQDLYLMTNPELLRSNLLEFVLRIKSMGIKNLSKFETITNPELNTISRALEILYFIGIIDESANLTEIGIKACDIPIDPRLSVALINSALGKFKCSEEVLIICSMLSIPNLFYQSTEPSAILKAKQRHGVIEGDHLTYFSIYKNWLNCKTSKSAFCKELHINENSMKQAHEIYNNLKLYFKKFQMQIKSTLDEDGEDILKSLLKGFFLNIAKKQSDGSYKSLRINNTMHLHPTSVLYTIMPEFIFYSDVVTSTKNYIKDASKIDKNWIMEIGNNYYVDKAQQVIREKHKMEVKNQIKIENENQNKKQGIKILKEFDKSNSLVSNKFFFEKGKNTDKAEESANKLNSIEDNFKTEDKIFENDFSKLEDKQKKFLMEDSNIIKNNKKELNEKKSYVINKYLKADVEEDEENNILNINPINPKFLENQTNDKNKQEKLINLDLNENKNVIANEANLGKLNYEELFNKNRDDKNNKVNSENMFLNRKKKHMDINPMRDHQHDEILEIKNINNNTLDKKEKESDQNFEDRNQIEKRDLDEKEKLPEDEEERIAMMRRKKIFKKPEKFKI